MDQSYKPQYADARFAVNHTGHDGVHVDRATRVMTAATHASFLDTGKMLLQAQQLADDTIGGAEAAYQDACARGYQAGLDQARGIATQENVERSLSMGNALALIEEDLTKLVLQALQRMLGDLDATEKVAQLVRQSLNQLGELQGEITIRCHPSHSDEIAVRLRRWNVSHPEANLTALADFDIAPDACHVFCSSGHVVASLAQQVAAIESALSAGCADPDRG